MNSLELSRLTPFPTIYLFVMSGQLDSNKSDLTRKRFDLQSSSEPKYFSRQIETIFFFDFSAEKSSLVVFINFWDGWEWRLLSEHFKHRSKNLDGFNIKSFWSQFFDINMKILPFTNENPLCTLKLFIEERF